MKKKTTAASRPSKKKKQHNPPALAGVLFENMALRNMKYKRGEINVTWGEWETEDGCWIDVRLLNRETLTVKIVHLYFSDDGKTLDDLRVYENQLVEDDSFKNLL